MLRKLFPDVYEGWPVVGSFALMIVTVFVYGFGTRLSGVSSELARRALAAARVL